MFGRAPAHDVDSNNLGPPKFTLRRRSPQQKSPGTFLKQVEVASARKLRQERDADQQKVSREMSRVSVEELFAGLCKRRFDYASEYGRLPELGPREYNVFRAAQVSWHMNREWLKLRGDMRWDILRRGAPATPGDIATVNHVEDTRSWECDRYKLDQGFDVSRVPEWVEAIDLSGGKQISWAYDDGMSGTVFLPHVPTEQEILDSMPTEVANDILPPEVAETIRSSGKSSQSQRSLPQRDFRQDSPLGSFDSRASSMTLAEEQGYYDENEDEEDEDEEYEEYTDEDAGHGFSSWGGGTRELVSRVQTLFKVLDRPLRNPLVFVSVALSIFIIVYLTLGPGLSSSDVGFVDDTQRGWFWWGHRDLDSNVNVSRKPADKEGSALHGITIGKPVTLRKQTTATSLSKPSPVVPKPVEHITRIENPVVSDKVLADVLREIEARVSRLEHSISGITEVDLKQELHSLKQQISRASDQSRKEFVQGLSELRAKVDEQANIARHWYADETHNRIENIARPDLGARVDESLTSKSLRRNQTLVEQLAELVHFSVSKTNVNPAQAALVPIHRNKQPWRFMGSQGTLGLAWDEMIQVRAVGISGPDPVFGPYDPTERPGRISIWAEIEDEHWRRKARSALSQEHPSSVGIPSDFACIARIPAQSLELEARQIVPVPKGVEVSTRKVLFVFESNSGSQVATTVHRVLVYGHSASP
jgi:hypothetical protein